MSSSASVRECQWLLRNMGFDRERDNERSALVLLALLGLKPNDPWTKSEARSLRTVEIMGWIRDDWKVDYKPNTRETIRRRTLHQFVQAHLVIEYSRSGLRVMLPGPSNYEEYLTDISWETDVWTADHPTHLVHFDGERFLGPYRD